MIDLSPEDFRRLGYQAIDRIAEHLASLGDKPTRLPVPDELRRAFIETPLNADPTDPAALIDRVIADVFPYPLGNASPRFFGWVNSPPAGIAVIAELLAAAHNTSAAGGDQASTYIEHGVLNWIKPLFGFPREAGAILTSGGSVANLIPLAVMRHVKAAGNMRARGMSGEPAPMVIYTSTQGHSCLQKAAELLGFGSDYLRKIPVDADFRMDAAALKAQIAADRAAGLRPVCVAASAGTVNTGALDPLDAIADVCQAENLWFHIDGAYGGFGILGASAAPRYHGIERADSLAVDPHKWLYLPVECGCALVRDAQAMRDTFSLVPPYLRDDRGLPWFSEFGIQQTRGFRALKLWMTLQHVGERAYRDLIEHDLMLARALQAKIRARDEFQLVTTGDLSITTFRYAAPGDAAEVDRVNRAALDLVQREGRAFLTGTELESRFVLRACIVNFRMTEADLDALLDTIADAARRVPPM